MANPVTRPAANRQVSREISYDHGSQAATASVKLWATKERASRIARVFYNNPTGFVADATNYWIVSITDGTSTLASWSTLTGAQGTLTADTPVELVNAAARDLAPVKNMIVTFTKTGAPANLPAGRLVVTHTVL